MHYQTAYQQQQAQLRRQHYREREARLIICGLLPSLLALILQHAM